MDEHEIQKLAPSTPLANLERIRIPQLVDWLVGQLVCSYSYSLSFSYCLSYTVEFGPN